MTVDAEAGYGMKPAELAALGAARVSWGTFLHMGVTEHFGEQLAALRDEDRATPPRCGLLS